MKVGDLVTFRGSNVQRVVCSEEVFVGLILEVDFDWHDDDQRVPLAKVQWHKANSFNPHNNTIWYDIQELEVLNEIS